MAKNKKFIYRVFSFFGFILANIIFIEICTRFMLIFFTVYDIEMTKYALALKETSFSSNLRFIHRPNQKVRVMGVELATNSLGLRSRETTVKATPGVYRVLALGDSLTLGWGVPLEDNFVSKIESSLNNLEKRVELLNAGHGNYNTEQEVEYYFKHGKHFDAKHVVLFYFINDAEELKVSSKLELIAHSRAASLAWSTANRVRNYSKTKNITYVDYYKTLYSQKNSGWEKAKFNLKKISNYCFKEGIIFQVVILPDFNHFKPYQFEEEHFLIEKFLKEQNIEYIDLVNVFRGRSPASQFWVALDDKHPNQLAHFLIAKEASKFIKKRMSF